MGHDTHSRRRFVEQAGKLASLALIPPAAWVAWEGAGTATETPASLQPTAWDLSWIARLTDATDRAVFDWPTLGDPADPSTLQFAGRYLDNCRDVYAPGAYVARVVFNIRTQAVPAALNDETWERMALGTAYGVKDPGTGQAATRNPFWHRAPSPIPEYVMPSLQDFVDGGSFMLVCDFALGHLARRLAPTSGTDEATVHRTLRAGLLPSAYAVPSGMFGLARAQNSGCAYMRF
jgi:hypothetical protein